MSRQPSHHSARTDDSSTGFRATIRRGICVIAAATALIAGPAAWGPGGLTGLAWSDPTPGESEPVVPTVDPAAAPTYSARNTDGCPFRDSPPPAVDASEVPRPGTPAPEPLPVPDATVGGDGLGKCGVIAASGTTVPGNLTSSSWLVADVDNGKVIAAKDPHGRYRPASTIKLLLADVVLKELDLDTVVTGTEEDAAVEGDSAGIGVGGKYTVRDLLTGLMMVSGNDCAHALARQLGGVEKALEKMNAEAKRLGALDTRAASPSGLDGPGMSTSAYDLALIFREGLKSPVLRELITTESAFFPGYPANPDVEGDVEHPGWTMESQNKLLYTLPGSIGGKTGYTDDAQKTYVGGVKRGDRTLMVVQLDGLSEAGDSYWDQAISLLDYGFAQPRDEKIGTLVDPDSAAANANDNNDNDAGDDEVTATPAPGGDSSNQSVAAPADSGPNRMVIAVVGLTVVAGLLLAATRLNQR